MRQKCKDDKTVGGWGTIDGETIIFIEPKRKKYKRRQYRNFGMANPEGYRKFY